MADLSRARVAPDPNMSGRENTMRFSRIVSLFVAVFTAAVMSAGLVAPAQSAPAKPKHDLQAAATEVGNSNHFVIYGTLSTYPKVFIFRKVGNGNYFLYRKVKVHDNGRWRTRVYQHQNDRTCFKVGVPTTDTYRQKIISVGCIVSY
jgi:hypothetical protein